MKLFTAFHIRLWPMFPLPSEASIQHNPPTQANFGLRSTHVPVARGWGRPDCSPCFPSSYLFPPSRPVPFSTHSPLVSAAFPSLQTPPTPPPAPAPPFPSALYKQKRLSVCRKKSCIMRMGKSEQEISHSENPHSGPAPRFPWHGQSLLEPGLHTDERGDEISTKAHR